ncbi:MAG: universal stress protein [Actinomycetes bacterium]
MVGTGWILVGVSDSPGSRAAVFYAAHAAARAESRLRIVHVSPSCSSLAAAGGTAVTTLARAVDEAGWYLSEDRIMGELVVGDTGRALSDLADGAVMIVMGHARAEVSGHASSGSLVGRVAGAAAVPVVVVPDAWAPSEPRARVVLGLKRADDIPEMLLQAALRVARTRHAELTVVHVREPNDAESQARTTEDTVHDIEQRIAGIVPAGRVPRVQVDVVDGAPGDVLGQESRSADLLLIARRAGTTSSGRFGGIGRELLSIAHCPVMVLPVAEALDSEDTRPTAAPARG